MTYAEDLKHPKWQRKRLEIMQRDGWKCSGCESDDKPLHVHHIRYISGRKPWEYADGDLSTFCLDCHKLYHSATDHYKEMNWEKQLGFLDRLIPEGARKFRAGPFMIFESPKVATGCVIFHVPTGYWHGFTLAPEAALEMFKTQPESRQELLKLILEGASAEWQE